MKYAAIILLLCTVVFISCKKEKKFLSPIEMDITLVRPFGSITDSMIVLVERLNKSDGSVRSSEVLMREVNIKDMMITFGSIDPKSNDEKVRVTTTCYHRDTLRFLSLSVTVGNNYKSGGNDYDSALSRRPTAVSLVQEAEFPYE